MDEMTNGERIEKLARESELNNILRLIPKVKDLKELENLLLQRLESSK